MAGGGGADHILFVEGHQVFQAAAAPGDDQHIGPGHGASFRQPVEAVDGGGDLLRRAFSLNQDRPQDHPTGEAVRHPVQDIANDGPGGGGDDADDIGQEGDFAFAAGVEKALGGQFFPPLLQQLEQGALPRQLHAFDHDLVFGTPGIGGQAPGGDDLHAVFRGKAQPPGASPPADPVQDGVGIFEGKIQVTRGGPLEPGNFPAHPHSGESPFHRTLEGLGNLCHREDGQIVINRVCG